MAFNNRVWLDSKFAETVTYQHSNVSTQIKSIVTRKPVSQFPVQGLNNQVNTYQVLIEVSNADVPVVATGRSGGDTVTLLNLKGVSETLRVVEIIYFDPDTNMYKLALS